jgi:CheY-like chemotaxis protein
MRILNLDHRSFGPNFDVGQSVLRQRDSLTKLGDRLRAPTATARVLVVEDNAVNQKVALTMLGTFGIRADLASNGRDGLQLLKILSYDVVFMDCQMPEVNGYELAAQVRKLDGPNKHVPIVALTAEVTSGCRERCLEAGMNDFISKPTKLEDIRKALETWSPLGLSVEEAFPPGPIEALP